MPYFESIASEKYLRGTLTLMVYAVLDQWSGVNVIQMLSNRMVTVMNSGVPAEEDKIQANLATQILGVSCFFVTFCAIYTIGVFNRKTLMIVG